MKLTECFHGRIVQHRDGKVGMVVGISENLFHEPVSVVQWQDGTTSPVHPANIEPLRRLNSERRH